MMLLGWIGRRSNNDSLEQLQKLYKELLISIGLGKDVLGTGNQEIETLPCYESFTTGLLQNGPTVHRDYPHRYRRNLPMALKLLSATTGVDNGGAVGTRDDIIGASLKLAQKMEERMASIICEIGKVVAYNDQADSTFRSDEVFEYFCEKNIIALFVDIAKSKPVSSELHGITWSPIVKAAVLRAVSVLLSSAQDGPSLYYLLSNNCISSLITGIVPLKQWSDLALEIMLTAYVELMHSVVHHLAVTPTEIFTCLKVGENFPLFSSTVEVAISPKSDSSIKSKCLSLIVIMLRVRNNALQAWIRHSMYDLKRLLDYLCDRLMNCYNQMVNLIVGPVVDHTRSQIIGKKLIYLKKQIEYMNQLLQAGVKSLNVLFCEIFLRNVVAKLLENLLAHQSRNLLAVGISDVDVIPQSEASVQLTLIFFTHFLSISYFPLIRMIAVSLFHPNSTLLWRKTAGKIDEERYAMTRELSKIAESAEPGLRRNEFREKILTFLAGHTGEWIFIPASMLVEAALASKALDTEILMTLGLVPKVHFAEGKSYPTSPMEEALSNFLIRKRSSNAGIVAIALKRVCILALRIFSVLKSADRINFAKVLRRSPLVEALAKAHYHFCQVALNARKKTGVSELFIDLTQLAIESRYTKLSSRNAVTPQKYGCVIGKFDHRSLMLNPEILVRKLQSPGSNDVEDCRFAIEMALQFRATCHTVLAAVEPSFSFPQVEWADDALIRIGDLKEKPTQGADLDLRGRMIFICHPAANRNQSSEKDSDAQPPNSSKRILVLDPTDIFVVKQASRLEANRATILCTISLRSIIAFASDDEWLHIAIRNMEDVGSLVKNGNLALRFETVGACLIVKQYLERSQKILRNELTDLIEALLQHSYIDEDFKIGKKVET
mmetsp:Transcript_20066/g.30178  ORF Transcript_20066/g.30178 Transcript_20066/m.30178 type:complete len:890 (-) Transcript_20066:18-2687(-)